MTALKSVAQCDSTKVCTSKSVLKYLYIQNETAHYLAKDTILLSGIIANKNKQLVYKDSLISNRNNALTTANNTTSLYKNEVEITSKKLKSFQLYTLIGVITTFIALLF